MSVQDRDLRSIQQARAFASRAKEAQKTVAGFSQEQVDKICTAIAEAGRADAERLAKMAHEETGFGNAADKTKKNLFASMDVLESMKGLRTVGVLREDKEKRIVEIAEPMGVVAAVIPSTNPTSTTIYKALVSIKARNAVVMSPHPSATKCIQETTAVIHKAAVAAGLPPDALLCMTEVTLEGTQELMKTRDVGVILATGGIGLVRAAYSSGRPAYGVGPGNVPVYVDRSADVAAAAQKLIAGKTFDYGTLCSSEQAVVADAPIEAQLVAELQKNGGHFVSEAEAAALAKVAVTPQRLPNPEIVGKPATYIAEKAGISVPAGTRALIARLTGVGRDFPLSIEKLCPILAFYVVADWKQGIERCTQLLRYGGTGHSAGIHCNDEAITREYAARVPVYRVIANSQTSMGATGSTTGLAPAMSLGCGAYAGNITSDNITPLHLMNVKRLAWELPAGTRRGPSGPPPPTPAASGDLSGKVAAFVAERVGSPRPSASPAPPTPEPAAPAGAAALLDFVSEDDVKRAIREGRRLHLAPKAIVTPAARDAASGTGVLIPS
jgi:acetaldehyde dehydrogenase (acetylating)